MVYVLYILNIKLRFSKKKTKEVKIKILVQQEAGQITPLNEMRTKQHWLLAEIHLTGPPQSDMAISPSPAAPAPPTSPTPASTGAQGANSIPLVARRA